MEKGKRKKKPKKKPRTGQENEEGKKRSYNLLNNHSDKMKETFPLHLLFHCKWRATPTQEVIDCYSQPPQQVEWWKR